MTDDFFARLARRMRGSERPRPEFVEDLYAELAARLEAPEAPAGSARVGAAYTESEGPVGAVQLDPEPEPGRAPGQSWRITAAAAAAALLVLGVPALLLRSAPPGTDPAATTEIATTTTLTEIVLEPGRPIGIALEAPVEAYYLLYLPQGYEGGPLPLVVALGSESGGHSGGLGFWGPDRADALGTAVISMAPTGSAWSYPATDDEAARVADTGAGSPPPVGSDDVTMIRAVLDDVTQRLPVEDVYVVGQYRGGLMVGRLVCELPGRITAAAGYPHAVYLPLACDPGVTPVPLMSIGPVQSEDTEPFSPQTAAEMLAGWAERAGCTGPTVSSPAPGVTETRYDGCIGGSHHLQVLVDDPAPEGWESPVDAIWQFLTSRGDGS